MNQEYTTAGNGLKKMFLGEIIALISAVVMIIPIIGLIGSLGAIAGSIVVLLGLISAGPAHDGYKKALYMVLASIVLSVLGAIFQEGAMHMIVSILSSAVGFLQTYFICTASGVLLGAKGDSALSERANLIIKLYMVSTIIEIVCSIVGGIPGVNILAAIASIVGGIVSIVALVLYVMFLNKASQSLLAA